MEKIPEVDTELEYVKVNLLVFAFIVRGKRKSVEFGYGRAAVTGYETLIYHFAARRGKAGE